MMLNAKEETFHPVTIRGQKFYFNDCRIDSKTIPKGWFLYEVRSTDEGWDPAEISEGILVNFYGTLISPEPITKWDEETENGRHFIYLRFNDEEDPTIQWEDCEPLESEWDMDSSTRVKLKKKLGKYIMKEV